jgi:hypothetical protein
MLKGESTRRREDYRGAKKNNNKKMRRVVLLLLVYPKIIGPRITCNPYSRFAKELLSEDYQYNCSIKTGLDGVSSANHNRVNR